MYILVDMPEMQVHACGEDREDDELETVYGCVWEMLLVRLRRRI